MEPPVGPHLPRDCPRADVGCVCLPYCGGVGKGQAFVTEPFMVVVSVLEP